MRFLGIIIGKRLGAGNSGQGSGGIGDIVCVIFYVRCAIAENYCVIFYADCDGEFIHELDGGGKRRCHWKNWRMNLHGF